MAEARPPPNFAMKFFIEKNYAMLSQQAANFVAQRLCQNPNLVLGLATGSTPLGLFKILAEKFKKKELDFSLATTFNLDEYCGLPLAHPQSYRSFMEANLFSKINLNYKRIFFPSCSLNSCQDYEEKIKNAGGIALQILGIGRNGHIGFNEPGSKFDSRTRIVRLSQTTIEDNARFFNNIKEVPSKAVTMGIATIMEAKEIVLLASGEKKQDIICQALAGPITEKVPASILQRHKAVNVILDKTVAEKLT